MTSKNGWRARVFRGMAMLAVAGATLSLPSSTAEAKKKSKSQQYSGFLGDYSDLAPHPKKDTVLLYKKEPGILGDYDRFMVDKVLIYLLPDSEAQGVDPEELSQLARHLQNAFIDAIEKGGRYDVAYETGPRILRIRAAITNVKPTKKSRTAAKTTASVAASAAVTGAGLALPRLHLGQASIEVELVDSQTGERVAAAVATKKGRRYFSTIRGFKRWGDVKAAFDSWAKDFREAIDEGHGRR